jgi:predicted Rossmann fold flavoprotein
MQDQQQIFHADLVVVGGGAAGFFAAINFAEAKPGSKVVILEKTPKFLSKVAISGGGRCNVTHDCRSLSRLLEAYPRGGKKLKSLFQAFGVEDTIKWFESRGVRLKTEEDGRMFPVTDKSTSITDCLIIESEKMGVERIPYCEVGQIVPVVKGYELRLERKAITWQSPKVILATGGYPKSDQYGFLSALDLNIVDPVPSLFTFNMPLHPFENLPGVSVPDAEVIICGTDFKHRGPLLITHWGISGPAVIVLSSLAARDLFDRHYDFEVMINWVADSQEAGIRAWMEEQIQQHGSKKVGNSTYANLPDRLWKSLCQRSGLEEDERWSTLERKKKNRLLEQIYRCNMKVSGKTTFKEEFVTSGGISLEELRLPDMELKKWPGLYAVGELTDVDGITGGYNFQYAWSSGFMAGRHAGVSSN